MKCFKKRFCIFFLLKMTWWCLIRPEREQLHDSEYNLYCRRIALFIFELINFFFNLLIATICLFKRYHRFLAFVSSIRISAIIISFFSNGNVYKKNVQTLLIKENIYTYKLKKSKYTLIKGTHDKTWHKYVVISIKQYTYAYMYILF